MTQLRPTGLGLPFNLTLNQHSLKSTVNFFLQAGALQGIFVLAGIYLGIVADTSVLRADIG